MVIAGFSTGRYYGDDFLVFVRQLRVDCANGGDDVLCVYDNPS